MAFITVRNGVVSSTNAKGFTLTESYTSKATGEVKESRYKVWSNEPVTEGATLNVSGIHSARVNEYDGKTYVEIHINSPRIEATTPIAVSVEDAPF
jgi:hypothetical protein